MSERSNGRAGADGQGRLLRGNGICDMNAKWLQEDLREVCSKQMEHRGVGHELGGLRRQRLTLEAWCSWLGRRKGLGGHWGTGGSVRDSDCVPVGSLE